MSKKYILMPGVVVSKNDRDRHYIDAHKLAKLYGVDMKDCIVASGVDARAYPTDVPILRPRYDGDYTLPSRRVDD